MFGGELEVSAIFGKYPEQSEKPKLSKIHHFREYRSWVVALLLETLQQQDKPSSSCTGTESYGW